MRRMARTAEAETVRVLDVLSSVAAGGRGDRPRGLRWDIATEVVAVRWRVAEDVWDAAEHQDVARASPSAEVELLLVSEMGSAGSESGSLSGDCFEKAGLLSSSQISVKAVSGVRHPLPIAAPAEFRSHPEIVGVVVEPKAWPR